MSDPNDVHNQGDGQPPEGGGEQPELPPIGGERAASVTFDRSGTDEMASAALMDPANQSLADALRITFRLVQLAMLVLAGLFLLSGFQTVRENESGIRLKFGRIDQDRLPPGFQFSWPYPVGEIVKVGTGVVSLTEDRAFWPALRGDSRNIPLDQYPRRAALDPASEGSVLTADKNIAHTRWNIVYRRERPSEYAQTIYPADEEAIVRAAVRRGVVRAIAQTKIDELLKLSGGEDGSVPQVARRVAQAMLDDIGSGIRIDRLELEQQMPPAILRDAFSAVQSAESRASQKREEAEADRRRALNAVAGSAAEHLIQRIDLYEEAIELGDTEEQERLLAQIDSLLEGEPLLVDGARREVAVSGQVTEILNDARLYRSTERARRQRDLDMYKARLTQFDRNPDVMVNRDWSDAFMEFVSHENVQLLFAPAGTRTLQLFINQDPDIVRELERFQREREARIAQERRELERRQGRFRTETGTRIERID